MLYIDIDIHHGDGVELPFYHSNRVMTVSFHKYTGDFFPGTGKLDDNGAGLGKYFCLNVPLQDGIDDDMYLTVFKTVIGDTVTHFQPSSIVLQCGADSLGLDRLGAFNLSIAAHGECVNYVRTFGVPLLVGGGGGYTVDNLNSPAGLQRITVSIREKLRYLGGAPSVAMREIPPGLEAWLAAEEAAAEVEEQEAEADASTSARPSRKRAAQNEFYAGDDDVDGDEDNGDGNGDGDGDGDGDGGAGDEMPPARRAPVRRSRGGYRRGTRRSSARGRPAAGGANKEEKEEEEEQAPDEAAAAATAAAAGAPTGAASEAIPVSTAPPPLQPSRASRSRRGNTRARTRPRAKEKEQLLQQQQQRQDSPPPPPPAEEEPSVSIAMEVDVEA